MARCRECSVEVRRSAEYCQQCGVRDPAKGHLLIESPDQLGSKSYFRGVGTILVIVVAVLMVGRLSHVGDVTATAPSCKTDWSLCTDNLDLANNYLVNSTAPFECKQEAIARAKYGDPKFPWAYPFSTFHVGDQYPKTGIAILIEKEAQYQNGFGAMVHSEVTCTYDLRAKRVVDINIAAE